MFDLHPKMSLGSYVPGKFVKTKIDGDKNRITGLLCVKNYINLNDSQFNAGAILMECKLGSSKLPAGVVRYAQVILKCQ